MSGKHPGGRPVSVWTPAARERLRKDFIKYLYETDLDGEYVNQAPNVSMFAFRHGISRQRLYEFEEFRELIELCHTKKEADLELGALTGAFPPSMAIFSLKQLGWKDNPGGDDEDSAKIKLLQAIADRLMGKKDD